MSEVSRIKIQAPGYYNNHGEAEAHSVPMRIEANLQTEHTSPPVGESSLKAARVWVRIREDSPLSSNDCEAGIQLSIQQADQLLSALLDIVHYVLPERRKL